MKKYSFIFRLIALLFFVSLGCFLLVEFSPIDPVQAYSQGMIISGEQKQEIANYFGLNQTPLTRYVTWLQGVFTLDLGESIIYRKPVFDVIAEKFTNSMILMISAWLLSGVIGFVLGIIMGIYKNSFVGKAIKSVCITLACIPTFLVGMICLLVFSVALGWFPIGFSVPIGVLADEVTLAERLHHLILPALTLSLASFSNIALHTRQKVVEVMESDYILYAKTRNFTKFQILTRHLLRNIMIPFVTLQFASLSEIFGGSILAETVFSYPGLGSTVVDAGLKGDVYLLLGIALFSGVFVFFGNLTSNIIYKIINPKIG